jgi:F-type H+-transporting ATPase subunit delta
MTYLLIMVRKKREALIHAIASRFEVVYKEYKNILTVHFRAPVVPDEDIRKRVLELMSHYTSAKIDLAEEIDAALIGGFVLSWEDKQYDASIRREIEELKRGVAQVNLYVKKMTSIKK